MALSSSIVWEVRTTGSDTNGGGFKAGASGTDWSQQNAAQYSVADAVTNNTTTVTSATAAFGTDVVGNLVYLSGSGTTTGWYEIVSRTNATTIVVDRATGSTGGTGVTLKIGGALASLTTLAAQMASSNKAFIKAGTYTEATTVTFGQAGVTPGPTVPASHLQGYNTTRGDITPWNLNSLTRPAIRINATGVNGLLFNNAGWRVEFLDVAPVSGTLTSVIRFAAAVGFALGCKVSSFTTAGIAIAAAVFYCEVTGGSGTADGIFTNGRTNVFGCYIHDFTAGRSGIWGQADGLVAIRNVVANLAGSCVGIAINPGSHGAAFFNTVYNCGSHGISFSSTGSFAYSVVGNILANNGGYGLSEPTTAAMPAFPGWDGNAFYANTSGTRQNLDDTSVNAVDGVAPYTNARDVILSASPFTNAAGGDFSLNNTAGGGAAARAAFGPPLWPGLTTAGYVDFGAIQHADPASGGGAALSRVFTGY